MSKQFGAVFKDWSSGGPVYADIKNNAALPTWQDWRSPGNTNANQTATEVFKHWDKNTMKRFEIFMEQFYRNNTPWQQDWLDRTAPNFKSNETKIVKCKMELIKRLLKIKLIGPESLEDWILLFLYTENQLRLPENIENLLRPQSSKMTTTEFIKMSKPEASSSFEYYVKPAEQWRDHPTNMQLWGFTPDFYHAGEDYNRPHFGYTVSSLPTTQAEKQRLTTRSNNFPLSTNETGRQVKNNQAQSLYARMNRTVY